MAQLLKPVGLASVLCSKKAAPTLQPGKGPSAAVKMQCNQITIINKYVNLKINKSRETSPVVQ